MHIFLDALALRKLELVKVLDNQEHFHSVTELSEKLNVSKTTTKKTLEELAYDFELLGSQAQLIPNDQKYSSVKLVHHELFLLDDLMSSYLNDEFIFKAFLDIFRNKKHNFKKFYEDEFVSTSTAYRKVNEMKSILKKFELTLDFTRDFPIVGHENQIRYFYACLFWSVYDGKTWYFDEPKENIKKLLVHLDNTISFYIHLGEKEFYTIWLAIIFQRTRARFRSDQLCQIQETPEQQGEITEISDWIISQWSFEKEDRKVIREELVNLIIVKELFSQAVNQDQLAQLAHGEIAKEVSRIVAEIEDVLTIQLTEAQHTYLTKKLLSFHSRNYFFKGNLTDFSVPNAELGPNLPQQEIRHHIEYLLEKIIATTNYVKLFENKELLLNYYSETLFETIMLEPELAKVKIAVFSIGDEQRIRSYKQMIEQNWFKPIEFVDDLNAPRDLNISDKYFEYLHKQNVELLIWSPMPTVKEIEQLNVFYRNFLSLKFSHIFQLESTLKVIE